MSYLDQRVTPARIWGIVVVAILHVLIGIAFVTGFAQKFTGDPKKDLKTFDVEEPPPPEEEPPPPEDIPPPPASPQIVTPPPVFRTPTPPVITTTPTPPPPGPPVFQALPPTPVPTPPAPIPPPPAPVPPPPPATPPTAAVLRSGTISNADYPASAIRAGASGTTRISLQIGADGRVTGCSVTGSSGNGALDSTACSLAQRRFRFTPATRNGQPVAATASRTIRWDLPD